MRRLAPFSNGYGFRRRDFLCRPSKCNIDDHYSKYLGYASLRLDISMKINFAFFSSSGSLRWIIQRVSGIVLLLYAMFILSVLVYNSDINYSYWRSIFAMLPVQVFTFSAILSLISHAWIGIQCVISDYITERLIGPKAVLIRKFCIMFFGGLMALYFVWGALILWNI